MLVINWDKIDWVATFGLILPILGVIALGTYRLLFLLANRKLEAEKDLSRVQQAKIDSLEGQVHFLQQAPQFELSVVQLTQAQASRRLEELQTEKDRAIREHDSKKAEELHLQATKLAELNARYAAVTQDHLLLQKALQVGLLVPKFQYASGAAVLRTGFIAVLRHKAEHVAVMLLDAGAVRLSNNDIQQGAARFACWYQPDGTLRFTSPSTVFLFSERKYGEPLQIGPLTIGWSFGGNASCWLYTGPQCHSNQSTYPYEIALTTLNDIDRVEGITLQFYSAKAGGDTVQMVPLDCPAATHG